MEQALGMKRRALVGKQGGWAGAKQKKGASGWLWVLVSNNFALSSPDVKRVFDV